MTTAIIRAQARRTGPVALTLPILCGAGIGLLGWWCAQAWSRAQTMMLVGWLEQILVICIGVCAVAALTGDPLVELHESTPRGFRDVQQLRAVLVAASGIVGSVVMYAPLHSAHVWPRDGGWTSVLAPAGAALFVVAVALTAAAYAGSGPAATIAVIAAWMFLALLWDPYIQPLLVQRGGPLVIVAIALPAVHRRLGDGEGNLAKAAA